MKIKRLFTLLLCFSAVLLSSCNARVSSVQGNGSESKNDSSDLYSGSYQYWDSGYEPSKIVIKKTGSGYCIDLYMNKGVESYSGRIIGTELVAVLDSDRELHLFKNGDELRTYTLKKQGYNPEDVDRPYYKTD